jgi:hypothetical protein
MSKEVSQLQLAQQSFELIKKDLGLAEESLMLEEQDGFEALHQKLTTIVQYLLDKDFGRLLNAMYRIDISEHQVKDILNFGKPDQIASELAKSIIEREKQKVITRIKYSR